MKLNILSGAILIALSTNAFSSYVHIDPITAIDPIDNITVPVSPIYISDDSHELLTYGSYISNAKIIAHRKMLADAGILNESVNTQYDNTLYELQLITSKYEAGSAALQEMTSKYDLVYAEYDKFKSAVLKAESKYKLATQNSVNELAAANKLLSLKTEEIYKLNLPKRTSIAAVVALYEDVKVANTALADNVATIGALNEHYVNNGIYGKVSGGMFRGDTMLTAADKVKICDNLILIDNVRSRNVLHSDAEAAHELAFGTS